MGSQMASCTKWVLGKVWNERCRAAAPSVSSAAVGERAPGAAERGATGDGGGGGDTDRARARRILLARQLARCPAQGRDAARLGTGPAGRLDGSGAGGECRASYSDSCPSSW